MINGLPIEYAQARLQARYGARASEDLWTQVRSARTFAALLASLRDSPLKRWVGAVGVEADADAIELHLRASFRECVEEVGRWMPDAWRQAVLWTRTLVDLPAIVRLVSGEAALGWMRRDPSLQPYADPDPEIARRALESGPLRNIVRELERTAGARVQNGAAREQWLIEWRLRWPDTRSEDAAALLALTRVVLDHLARFTRSDTEDPWALRRSLESQVSARFRRHAFTATAAFAYLLLTALDLERLRAHLVVRATFAAVP
ncbi:MAG: hypothetical protein ACKVQT_28935 [Burkholderiales bacterium]